MTINFEWTPKVDNESDVMAADVNALAAATLAILAELLNKASIAEITAAIAALTKSDVGLGNVTNESKSTMFTDAALTGNPTAPTQTAGNNSTRIATTAYVMAALAALADSAPATLDTLNELAAALGDDPNFATTITNALASKAPLQTIYNQKATSDVSMTTSGTAYTGTSLTLPVGTYIIFGTITALRSTAAATQYSARISDGTTHYASFAPTITSSTANANVSATMATTITLSQQTTINIQMTANQSSCTIKAALYTNGAGNNATQLTALKIS